MRTARQSGNRNSEDLSHQPSNLRLIRPTAERRKVFKKKNLCELRALRITVSPNLRGMRKFSDMENISDSDHSPAKAQRRQVQRRISFLQNLCAFATLREVFRILAAALPR
jgi:hypothetical protein